MNRVVLGAVSALLLAAAGLFWWQGKASVVLGGALEVPGVAREEDRHAVAVLGDGEGMRGDEGLERGGVVRARPARGLEGRLLEGDGDLVLVLDARAQDVELQRADHADDSAICCKASRSFLAFIASPSFTRRRISGAKLGTPWKTSSSPSVSVSPMRSRP